MTEDDGVRNLHHGGFQVGREQDALVLGPGYLRCQELIKGASAHERAVNNFVGQDGEGILQNCRGAICGNKLNLDLAVSFNDN